jgi:hypothetical protein
MDYIADYKADKATLSLSLSLRPRLMDASISIIAAMVNDERYLCVVFASIHFARFIRAEDIAFARHDNANVAVTRNILRA